MKLKTFSLSLLMCAAFGFYSCSDKDDDKKPADPQPQQPAATRTDLLTNQIWKGDKRFVNGADMTNDSLFTAGFPRVKETSLKFEKAGTFRYVVRDDTASGTWQFRNDEKDIYLKLNNGGLLEGIFKVPVLTATNLSLEKDTTVIFNGMNFQANLREQYVH